MIQPFDFEIKIGLTIRQNILYVNWGGGFMV